MSRRIMPSAAVVAIAALAVALPVSGAAAATHAPPPAEALPGAGLATCQIMGYLGGFVGIFGNPVYGNAQNQLFTLNGCA
jgi:hypothetical protein